MARILLFLSTLISGLSTQLFAQQSWVWSRDDNSRPINLDTDAISLMVLEARVPSGNNFIATDSQVGLLVDTNFQGSTADTPQVAGDFPSCSPSRPMRWRTALIHILKFSQIRSL